MLTRATDSLITVTAVFIVAIITGFQVYPRSFGLLVIAIAALLYFDVSCRDLDWCHAPGGER